MEIQKGSKVRINLDYSKTEKKYGLNDRMICLSGSVQTVFSVNTEMVEIDHWFWHIDDVTLIDENSGGIQIFDSEYVGV